CKSHGTGSGRGGYASEFPRPVDFGSKFFSRPRRNRNGYRNRYCQENHPIYRETRLTMAHIDKDNVMTLLGEKILPGESAEINFKTAKLYTTTSVKMPVFVERSKKKGAVILIT